MAKMGKLIEDGMKAGFVRLSNSKVTVTDGPFAEAKELIGGLAILQANSREEAIDLARQFLHVAGDGECELRQLFDSPARQGGDASRGVVA